MDDCDWLLSVEKACDWLRIKPGVTVNFYWGTLYILGVVLLPEDTRQSRGHPLFFINYICQTFVVTNLINQQTQVCIVDVTTTSTTITSKHPLVRTDHFQMFGIKVCVSVEFSQRSLKYLERSLFTNY